MFRFLCSVLLFGAMTFVLVMLALTFRDPSNGYFGRLDSIILDAWIGR